jgi:hypothetical protein
MPVLDPVDFNYLFIYFCRLLYFTVKSDRPLVFCYKIRPSLGIYGEIWLPLGILWWDLIVNIYIYRLLCNLNQIDNQICKAVKINNTDISLRSENSLYQREKSLWESQIQEINYQKKQLITRSSYSQPFSCSHSPEF